MILSGRWRALGVAALLMPSLASAEVDSRSLARRFVVITSSQRDDAALAADEAKLKSLPPNLMAQCKLC